MNSTLLGNFTDLILGGSAFVLFTLSAGYYFERERYGRLPGFLIYFMQGIETLLILAESSKLYLQLPWIMYLNQPFEFLWAPLVYWYLRTRFERGNSKDPLLPVLFVPALLIFAAFLPFFLQPAAVKLANPGFENFPPLAAAFYRVCFFTALPWLVAVEAFLFFRIARLLGRKSLDHIRKIRHFGVFCALWIAIFLLNYILYQLHTVNGYKVMLAFLNYFFVLTWFLEGRALLFFGRISQETNAARYSRSRLRGIDTRLIVTRIQELFGTEELYRDEDITLSRLAQMLGISVQQLSEIFNNGMKTTFRSYLNLCRIAEAKRTLAVDSEISMLNLAYRCGYNSKSAFNTAFMKLTGMSPSELRSTLLSNKSK